MQQEEQDITKEIGELKEIHVKIVKKENKIKASKIEQDQEIEKYDCIIKEAKGKISHWKKNLSKLELQEIPFDRDTEDPVELNTLAEEELLKIDPKKLGHDLSVLEEKLALVKPNLAVLQEYRKKVGKLFTFLSQNIFLNISCMFKSLIGDFEVTNLKY